MTVNECDVCRFYVHERRDIVAACDAVDLVHGRECRRLLIAFLTKYHRSAHREIGLPANESWSGCEIT
jgi:hypothetical protein